tara:strand:- start:953 stop:1696 length:744 start_codon:yes stop_codon:yes gene_type:complete
MIYEKYNFIESYSNANGSKQGDSMLAKEVGRLIAIDSVAVSNALQEAGIDVKDNCSKKKLIEEIYNNSDNRKMIENLSTMLVLKENLTNTSDFSNVDGEKSGIFSSIGNWFKERKERKAKESRGDIQIDKIDSVYDLDGNLGGAGSNEDNAGSNEDKKWWKKIGDFVNKNQDTIRKVGGGVGAFLQNRRNREEMERGSKSRPPIVTRNTNGGGNEDEGMSTTTKVLIGVGIAIAIGGFIYLAKRTNK